jgi:hypothetical protein
LSDKLNERGFNLRKWSSNSRQLLSTIPIEYQEKMDEKDLLKEFVIKALGIQWSPMLDTFSYILKLDTSENIATKRQFISNMASLFDPLGWVSPVIIRVKILAQHLWTRGIDWDDKIPADINEKWIVIKKQLNSINEIKIDRWIKYSPESTNMSIQGFCDASELAYAAVVYLRIETNKFHCKLLAAKAKVAPLNKQTLPRLELMAAVLLTKLVKKTIKAMNITNVPITAWSDSKIALDWIASHPSNWKTFVANRTSLIHNTIPAEKWRHIPTELNPADYGSRGVTPNELKTLTQWWEGPAFLLKNESEWPQKIEGIKNDLEQRKEVKLFTIKTTENVLLTILDANNCLHKLLRTTAYWLRIIHKVDEKLKYTIMPYEFERASLVLARCIQQHYFAEEVKQLKSNKPISKSSKLISYTPFLDKEGTMRLLGRLQNSEFSHEQKHQILLPANTKFNQLLIDDAHMKTMHGGTKIMLQYLRNKWWILNAKTTIKFQIRKCVTCTRFRAEAANQLMGNLPASRVQKNLPFMHTGIDFAGHFEIKTSTLRNSSLRKCYIALFICMTTKAIHLELASSLSTNDFLQCLKRFTSRRGKPSHIYSDNGTNFIGAANILPQLLRDSTSETTQKIVNEMAKEGIQWHFNPPKGAHFGGIWEANIKCAKYHLIRVLKETKLVYEDYETILTQIEAILNSRPLCKLSENSEEGEALTPGHFLIGRTLISLPQPSVLQIPSNRLDHYQYLQRIVQEYWKEWSTEYLCQMQQRSKWRQPQENLEIGQIVLIIEDNLPPTKWCMGRIIQTFPGNDSLLRVVTIQTKDTTLKRPIHKLCILPIKDTNEAEIVETASTIGALNEPSSFKATTIVESRKNL